jgi:hypothetical protein
MEQTQCSETSAIKHHTPGNNQNSLPSHTSYPLAYEDGTPCSETSAIKHHTPRKNPKATRNIQNTRKLETKKLILAFRGLALAPKNEIHVYRSFTTFDNRQTTALLFCLQPAGTSNKKRRFCDVHLQSRGSQFACLSGRGIPDGWRLVIYIFVKRNARFYLSKLSIPY